MGGDVIQYIMKLLRYVARENEERYLKDVFVVGDCVHDLLLQHKDYRKITLVIKDRGFCQQFLDFLKMIEILVVNEIYEAEENDHYDYCLLYHDRTVYFHIIPNFAEWMENGFLLTCNNICLDWKGNVACILSSDKLDVPYPTPYLWTLSCMQDVLQKSFRPIVLKHHCTLKEYYKYFLIMESMQKKGWTYRKNQPPLTKETIPDFQSHSAIQYKDPLREPSQCCSICDVSYEENPASILLTCLHDFHVSCLHKWMHSSGNANSKKCPLCREWIQFTFSSTPEETTIL